MIKRLVAAIAAVAFIGCADQPLPTETEITLPLFAKGGNAGFNMQTHLTGAEEVFDGDPHPEESRAQGQAIFRVSRDGSTADFRLIVANIENVIMAHIHCGPRGVNGPVRMWLHPVIGPTGASDDPGQGRFNGVLASGTFSFGTQTCPASAVGQDMPLLAAMREGLTYVNVHTDDGVPPQNTGPGDFFGGEVRGQIDHASH
jgi:hypothetical protein